MDSNPTDGMFDISQQRRSPFLPFEALAAEISLVLHLANLDVIGLVFHPTVKELLKYSGNFLMRRTVFFFAACNLFVSLVRSAGSPVPHI